ncbi:hypothetical protein M3599_15355 [Niallia circulans]|uniref:hypothetical protein n=1 Tax=Niallia circulans TaxID=1397 RepID=UPI00203A7946|nr:hypothetical protein [Niallia circulans]MCM2982302.1 hypothetical protein [Niallia circulans]
MKDGYQVIRGKQLRLLVSKDNSQKNYENRMGYFIVHTTNGELATLKQVAEFYNVKISTLTMCVYANEEELRGDGYHLVKGLDLVYQLNWKAKKCRGYIEVEDSFRIPYNDIGLFPKRAVLRMGMLLRDSLLDSLYSITEKGVPRIFT